MKTIPLITIMLGLTLACQCTDNARSLASRQLPAVNSLQASGSPGQRTTYEYNAGGFLVKYTNYEKGKDGRTITPYGAILTYNAQGLVARIDRFGIGPISYETYAYTDGKLSTITFFENGTQVHQYAVETNANGQITFRP